MQFLKDQYFSSFDDVIVAYRQSILHLHTFVWVRLDSNKKEQVLNSPTNLKFIEKKITDRTLYLTSEIQIKKASNGEILQMYIKTTPGRILLNKSFEYKS